MRVGHPPEHVCHQCGKDYGDLWWRYVIPSEEKARPVTAVICPDCERPEDGQRQRLERVALSDPGPAC